MIVSEKENKNVYEFPLIIRLLLKAFYSEVRQRILLILLNEGEKPYNDLLKRSGLKKKDFTKELLELNRYSTINTRFTENDLNDEHTILEISKLGRKFANILLDCVRIEKKDPKKLLEEAMRSKAAPYVPLKEDPYHPPCECGHNQEQHYDFIEEAYGECNECNCSCYKKAEK